MLHNGAGLSLAMPTAAMFPVCRQRMEQQAALDKEQEMLEADPFDPEAQRKIEEFIHNKNIEENYAHAMEHTPEVCVCA